MSTPPNPDPAYEIVLRETQRRVETPASDADLAAMHRGRRRIDHRAAEIERLLDILKRAQKKLKGRHDALRAESEGIGQIADREKVERLVLCEVVHDARQGGVIFIRRKDTREVIPNSYRPLSAEERNVFADLKPQPDLIPGMSPTVDEELAKKLRLSEYLADAAPADIDAQIEEALAASALAPELQDALLTIEADANEEEEKPKAKKPKKEKAPAEPKEPKAKGKGGRKKKDAAPPPPPVEEPETDEEIPEPGPDEMEPDEPERPALPRRPDAPRAVPQPPEAEDGTDEEEPAPQEDESEPDDDAASDSGEDAPAEDGAESDGKEAVADEPSGEEPEAAAGETVASEEEPETSASDDAANLGESFLDDDGSEDAESDGETDEIPDYETSDDSGEAAPAADPYPEAYDADSDDVADPEWVDASVTPAPADEPEQPAPAPEASPEPEPIAKAYEPAAEAPAPKKARKKKGEEPAALPTPRRDIEIGWVRGSGFAGGPLAHYDATFGPEAITFKYYVYDEVDRADAQPRAEEWAAAWKKEGAVSVTIVPVVDPTKAPKPPAPEPPSPPAQPAPAPTPTGQPPVLPASERNVGNDFGLAPGIAKRFGEAIVQQIKKGPFLASTAIASMERYFGAVMTENMKLALLPVLEHMSGEGTIKRQVAGSDIIYYLTEPKEGFDAWRTAQRRK